MRVFARGLALLAVFGTLGATSARAQIQPNFGGGILSPSGDFADYAKSGWLVFAGADKPIGTSQRAVAGIGVFYGHASHEGPGNTATNIPGATVDFGYALTAGGKFTPYVRGGVGFLQHRFDAGDTGADSDSETKFAFGGGGGVATAVGSNLLFIGAHYIGAEDTNFLTFYVGFGLGGGAPSMLRR